MEEIKTKSSGRAKMVFTKKRKIIILAGLFVLLCVTGYLNFKLNNKETPVGGDLNNTNLFTMFRQTRADDRSANIAVLESIAQSTSGYSEAAKQEAESALFQLLAAIQFETTTENLILAQNYEDTVVSKIDGNVNVLIKKNESITRAEAAQILGILRSVESGLDIDNVFISVIE